jgi:predicted PhzF superfamily epimerase YddE/YHI9
MKYHNADKFTDKPYPGNGHLVIDDFDHPDTTSMQTITQEMRQHTAQVNVLIPIFNNYSNKQTRL